MGSWEFIFLVVVVLVYGLGRGFNGYWVDKTVVRLSF